MIKSILFKYNLYIAWLFAFSGTFGSLYFSEIEGYVPCQLCWYQRIVLYPILILLTTIIIKKDYKYAIHLISLSIIGVFLSAFHYAEQKISVVAEHFECSLGVPCSGEYINLLGFITIPFLSLLAFLAITLMFMIEWQKTNK